MKRIARYIETAVMFLPVFLSSCSPPDSATGGPEPSGYDISIAYLKSLYSGHPIDIAVDHRIRGTVVSTDDYGNYYKTLVVADSTGGIEIKMDMENIFREFFFGDEVYVYCNGLTLGAYSGLVQLGAAAAEGDSYETGYIGENIVTAHLSLVRRSPEEPQALRATIDGLSAPMLSRLVRFCDVEFVEEEHGLLWCDPDADTDRHLTDRDGNVLTVRTSRYAEFASQPLPPGSGYIQGILSYFNGEYLLKVPDPRMIDMQGERFFIIDN